METEKLKREKDWGGGEREREKERERERERERREREEEKEACIKYRLIFLHTATLTNYFRVYTSSCYLSSYSLTLSTLSRLVSCSVT